MTSPRVLIGDIMTATLPDEIPAGITLVSGSPTAAVRELTVLGDVSVGIWQMTAGTARDVESEEVFVVLAGAATVTFADGETLGLRPGMVVRLEAGEHTEWDVTETLRKIYVSR